MIAEDLYMITTASEDGDVSMFSGLGETLDVLKLPHMVTPRSDMSYINWTVIVPSPDFRQIVLDYVANFENVFGDSLYEGIPGFAANAGN